MSAKVFMPVRSFVSANEALQFLEVNSMRGTVVNVLRGTSRAGAGIGNLDIKAPKRA
jgi:hypothetical protein